MALTAPRFGNGPQRERPSVEACRPPAGRRPERIGKGVRA